MSVLFGVVPESAAFAGFGHPAVVTVVAVLIISQGLNNAGVVDVIAERIKHYAFSPIMLLGSLMLIVTILSAFMNNVGALALMLPITMMAATEYNLPPARLLMPLAFGSILGGLTTLIDTPPNIIIASYREEMLGSPYSMFEFAPVGIPVAIVGIIFVILLGWRFIPKARIKKNASLNLFEIDSYLTEIQVRKGCSCIGRPLSDLPLFEFDKIELLGVATPSTYAQTVQKNYVVKESDIFIIRADPTKICPLIDRYDFKLLTTATRL